MATAQGQSPRSNGVSDRDYSPRRQKVDAQRRQIDLEQAFNDMRIHDAEIQKLHTFRQRIQREEADLKENSLAKIHQAALEKVQKSRDNLRQQAEAVLQRHLREEEEKRRRKQEEEEEAERQRLKREAELKAAREQERARKAREEEERKKREEQEREQARIREEEAKAKAEAEERQRKQKLDQEQKQQQQARERQEGEQKEREAEAARQAEAAKQAGAKAQAGAQAASNVDVSAEKEHEEYIALYFKLKKWQNDYWDQLRKASKPPNQKHVKEAVSDARGIAKTEVGKLSYGTRENNRLAESKITKCLNELLSAPAPIIGTRIPVNFFLPPSLSLNDNDQTTITDQAAYFLCHIVKQITKLFSTYVSTKAERAEPIGTLVTKLFGTPALQYARQGDNLLPSQKSQSLVPIFLAKYHKVCPGLFGITASQDTVQGRRKLGWRMIPAHDDETEKSKFYDKETQYDRVAGLTIGYSAFALRNASTVKIDNPYPPKYFWKSLAQLINLPPAQVQPLHLCILRNMFEHDAIKRFLLFYGDVGVALIREAYIEFPKRLPAILRDDSFYIQVSNVMAQLIEKNEPLHLT